MTFTDTSVFVNQPALKTCSKFLLMRNILLQKKRFTSMISVEVKHEEEEEVESQKSVKLLEGQRSH